MSSELAPFTHPVTDESYLFAFEDYLSDDEVERMWDNALWILRAESHSQYGELADDLGGVVMRSIGLKPPLPNSALEEFVSTQIHSIEQVEKDNLEIERERGYPIDDETEQIPISLLKMRRSL